MRVVFDTNVLVSALLKADSVPSEAVLAGISGRVRPLVDARIVAEYEAVLSRPRFAFSPQTVERFLADFEAVAEMVRDPAPYLAALPDTTDRPFIEVALAGRADVIVTGNTKHFTVGLSVLVVSPTELIRRLHAGDME